MNSGNGESETEMMYCPECGAPVQQQTSYCPKCGEQLPCDASRQTVVERVPDRQEGIEPESVRHTVIENLPELNLSAAEQGEQLPPGLDCFRPVRRPPMALLTALDDGRTDSGEVWRVRKSRHVIGREQGDTLISHDDDVSAEHVEVTRRWQDGSYCWHLTDLDSTNGTFLRVKKVVLRNGQELLIGGRRYQFRAANGIEPRRDGGLETEGDTPLSTGRFRNVTPSLLQNLVPRLVELHAEGTGREFKLHAAETLMGSDPEQCQLVVQGDPFVGLICARIFQDARQRWLIEDAGSINGVWMRVQRVRLELASQFQIGEQRFHFQIL